MPIIEKQHVVSFHDEIVPLLKAAGYKLRYIWSGFSFYYTINRYTEITSPNWSSYEDDPKIECRGPLAAAVAKIIAEKFPNLEITVDSKYSREKTLIERIFKL